MNISCTIKKGIITLTFFVGVLPFLNIAHAHAEEESGASRWLDDYHQHVGLTYGAQATVNAAYLWRGLYVGGLNLQANANVGYGGLYFDAWCNIGTADWSFTDFQPEVDFTLGFSRWGLDVHVISIHNFNCGFFDFSNRIDQGCNALEIRARYTVSSKLPLSFLWATRVLGADGYRIGEDTIRAYSSYAELSYTQALPFGLSLYGAIGITPWRSFYTGYERGFAVNNLEVRLAKDWSLSEHCGLKLQGVLAINPSLLAADRSTAKWHPRAPWDQSVNVNIAAGVYLK